MFGFLDQSACPIGIDVGNHSVRLLQFRRNGDKLALQAATRVDLAPLNSEASSTERLSAALKSALSAARFSGKRAVLSLPPAAVQSKSVRLPQMPESDLSQALTWEAKDRFGFEIGDGRIVWFRAGEVRRGTEIKDELLLFAVQSEALTAHLDACAGAGLTVEAIDLASCAIYRATRRSFSDPGAPAPEAMALLDIGHAGSQFIIIRNDQLVFYKQIDIGGNAINQAVGQKLGITPAEAGQMRTRLAATQSVADDAAPLGQALQDAMRPTMEDLAKELDMCMRYFVVTFRGARPDLISLSGRQATCPFLLASLGSSLGLNVQASQPLRAVASLGDAARPDRSSEWAVAAGLSLYPPSAKTLEAAA